MMGAKSLALRASIPEPEARELLRLHRQTYPRFWAWSQSAVDRALLTGSLHTVLGWRMNLGCDRSVEGGGRTVNPRSLANFPMQAHGAEVLRLACCMLTEGGIDVCTPVHDAVLVEGPSSCIQQVVSMTEACMRSASQIVLGGFSLRTDAKIIAYPDRYADPRGVRMWTTTMRLIGSPESMGAPAV
jgi:DNA polymerase-1